MASEFREGGNNSSSDSAENLIIENILAQIAKDPYHFWSDMYLSLEKSNPELFRFMLFMVGKRSQSGVYGFGFLSTIKYFDSIYAGRNIYEQKELGNTLSVLQSVTPNYVTNIQDPEYRRVVKTKIEIIGRKYPEFVDFVDTLGKYDIWQLPLWDGAGDMGLIAQPSLLFDNINKIKSLSSD